MDIQVPSNLERYLYELSGHDPDRVRRLARQHSAVKDAWSCPTNSARRLATTSHPDGSMTTTVEQTIRSVYREHGIVIDPHTAVGWEVGRRLRQPGETLVTMAPAHPAKFGDVVRSAVGFDPPLPDELADLMDQEERIIQHPQRLRSPSGIVGEGLTLTLAESSATSSNLIGLDFLSTGCYYLPHRPAPGTSGITPQIGRAMVRGGSVGSRESGPLCFRKLRWNSTVSLWTSRLGIFSNRVNKPLHE